MQKDIQHLNAMSPEQQADYEMKTALIEAELKELVSRRPRTVLLEKRIQKLIKRAGWPQHAKEMFRPRI